MKSRLIDAARNEALFRSLNEEIKDIENGKGADASDPIDFVCECSSSECMKVVSVSREEYEAVQGGRLDLHRHARSRRT